MQQDAKRSTMRFRFGLRALFGGITAIGLLLAVLPWAAAVVMAPLVLAIYFAARSPFAASKRSIACALLVLLALVGAECVCADLAYYTLSELDGFLLYGLVLLNAMALLLCFISWRAGILAALLIAMLVIPEQVELNIRWRLQQREAVHLIHYLEQQKLARGSYPSDLVGYKCLTPKIRSSVYCESGNGCDVTYWPDQPCGYVISYHIGSTTTCHEYSPKNGWSYYPD